MAGAWAQIDHELDLIESLGFPGYFLIVWDIVHFCERHDIYCQGRGSAANSAVCFALGVTKADAVQLGLLFERFLSPERDGPPDIDLDIESGRREEVIQYVYERYGRSHAAQVANVITYRSRSAVRDAARALGFAPGQQDAWAKSLDRWGSIPAAGDPSGDRQRAETGIPEPVLEFAGQLEDLPRHLGIHSGGMVMCDRPVVEVCPTEWARMENRSVLQWDKDDCAAAGLVKFDLLGLGMLSALHFAVDLVREHEGIDLDLAELPQDDAVYDMLCRADSVGVFQVESRAQMATLPRLRPRCFYDLVIEIALIRPGPIQGGSVHPYIRRRKGEEPVTYLHPLLEKSLAKTLGVPLFQEQLMQMAIDVAGFTPSEADQLRQAMGSKRSDRRMAALRDRFDQGLARNGITGSVAESLWNKLAAFAQLRLPGVALGELRLPGVLVVLAQAAPSGGVLRGPAQGPTDGFLLTPVAGPGRPSPRRRGADPGSGRLGLVCGSGARPRGRAEPSRFSGRFGDIGSGGRRSRPGPGGVGQRRRRSHRSVDLGERWSGGPAGLRFGAGDR